MAIQAINEHSQLTIEQINNLIGGHNVVVETVEQIKPEYVKALRAFLISSQEDKL